ncbi:potassium-transporting ATPase subunit F [Gordonia effusa]|nr:potassium-transporting ATPase subunit F [Gordonia effusa]
MTAAGVTSVVLVIIALAVVGYLLAALVYPERF